MKGQQESRQAGYQLPRSQRITDSQEIRAFFEKGRKRVGRFIVLWVKENDKKTVRVAVIASKKSMPKASERSRAKRLMKEAFRLNKGEFAEGTDILMIGRRKLGGVKRQDVDSELLKLAAGAGVLRSGQ